MPYSYIAIIGKLLYSSRENLRLHFGYACISLSTNTINLSSWEAKVTSKKFLQFRSFQIQLNLPKTSPVWVTPPPVFLISAFSVIMCRLLKLAMSLHLSELCARPERTWRSNNIHLVTKLAGWGGRRGEHAVGRGKLLPTCYHRVGQYIMGTQIKSGVFSILSIIILTDGFISTNTQ